MSATQDNAITTFWILQLYKFTSEKRAMRFCLKSFQSHSVGYDKFAPIIYKKHIATEKERDTFFLISNF